MAVVSHWTADNTAVDSVGTNNGTLVSGTTYAAGQVGQAFKFDGVNDRVQAADSASFKLTQSLTIEAWIRVDAIPSSTTPWGIILFRGDDRGGLDPYQLAISNSGNLSFQISSLTSGMRLEAPVPKGQFVHVAATLDDATGEMKVYENGVLMAQTVTTVRPFADLDPASNPGVGIGNHGGFPNTPHNFPFNGLIDDLKLYDSALTVDEILTNFNATKGNLQPTLSINDSSGVEGTTSTLFVGEFVASGSGGLSGARNIAYGPDGNLYVVSAQTNSVLRYDRDTGAFIDIFVVSGSGGLDNPWAMAFGPDGNLYITGRYTGVLRYDGTTGTFIDVFVSSAAYGIPIGINGILFGTNGDLYVSNSAGGGGAVGLHEVLRFQGPNAASPGAPKPAPGKTGAVFVSNGSGGLSNPNGLAIGPDGSLYVANTYGDSINRYSASTGAYLSTFVGIGNGSLDAPSQIVFRPDGFLYVTSQASQQVLRYDAIIGSLVDAVVPAGSGGLSSPNGILFDASGNLYVASAGTSSVLRFAERQSISFTVSLSSPLPVSVTVDFATANGTAAQGSDYTNTYGTLTFLPGQLTKVILVNALDDAISEGDETFVVNLSNAAGAIIADGQSVGTIIDNELPPTKFYLVNDGSPDRTYEYGAAGEVIENYSINSGNTAPRGAASNAAGDRVWVIDNNRKVYVYDTSGGLLGSWSAGTLASNASVQGIATNGTDVWIVDSKSDKVYRYNGAASRLSGSQNAASSFSLNGSNSSPTDIVTDGTSFWVVNDTWLSDRVFRYSLGGSLIGSWTISTPGVSSPTGITLNPASPSELWIVDNGTDRVYQYNAAVGVTSGSRSASSSFALAAGNTNPQGIADPPPPGNSVRMPNAVMASPTSSTFMAPMANSKASDIALISLSGDVVSSRVGKPFEHDRADSEQSLATPQSRNSVIAFSTQQSMQPATSENRASSQSKRLSGTTDDIFSHWNSDELKDFDMVP